MMTSLRAEDVNKLFNSRRCFYIAKYKLMAVLGLGLYKGKVWTQI